MEEHKCDNPSCDGKRQDEFEGRTLCEQDKFEAEQFNAYKPKQ